MKNRIKWMLAGVGFMFGLQVIISLIYTGVAFSAARSETGAEQGSISLLVFGFTLGAFLVGGFVIGWMSEKLRLGDALAAAIVTFALTALVYTALPPGNKGQFVTANWFVDASGHLALRGQSGMFILLALVATTGGNYLGWRVNVPAEGLLDRIALVIGLLGAVVGPFVLLAIGGREPGGQNQPNLPWYFLVIVLALLLVIIGVGFVMFTRESTHDEDISINPEHHKEG